MFQWIYGLFLELITYCANSLLKVMTTDLTFWETSVPVVRSLYRILVAVGWGLLIGNLAFQSLKAMFAGLGFETESPAILLFRTAIFGTLLMFSRDICNIGLSIGKNVMNLIGIPSSVKITTPNESAFGSLGSSWLLVIIIGFILGFQLIKLFFEIAERYVVVAVLTLLCPIGLAMGGSKSTKDICTGFIRSYASMIVMMVMNVLFLKLILSALATMPAGLMVLPWCLLVVGIVKTARKTDNLISKIGLNPAITGDSLGTGRGAMAAMMAAKTIINSASKSGKAKSGSKTGTGSSKTYSNSRNMSGGTNIHHGGVAQQSSASMMSNTNANSQNAPNMQNSQSSRFGAPNSTSTAQSASSSRFGSVSHNNANSVGAVTNGNMHFNNSGKTQVNTNRFGSQLSSGQVSASAGVSKKDSVSGTENKSPKATASKVSDNIKPGKKSNMKSASAGVQKTTRFGTNTGSANKTTVSGLRQNTNPFKKSGMQMKNRTNAPVRIETDSQTDISAEQPVKDVPVKDGERNS